MGARIGKDTDNSSFNLPQFKDTDKTPDQIADEIAMHLLPFHNNSVQ